MNKDDQFSSLFRNHGKPLQVAHLPSATRQRYQQQIQFYRAFDPTIYVGVVGNAGFNAVASKNSFGEFIALYIGAISQLTLYAYQMFSDPRVHPDIGDSSIETCEQAIIDKLRVGDINTASKLRYLPNDPIRRNVAERIAECACLILFLHEAAHIRGCHLSLIYEEYGLSEHQEINAISIDESRSLLLRALELEADNLALFNSLNMWRDLAAHTGVHDVEVLGPTRSWLIAAELVFLVMSFNHDLCRVNQLSSHPSILTRFLNIRFMEGPQGIYDRELTDAAKQGENSLVHWVRKHKLSSSILRFFNEPFREADLAEWRALRHKLEALWPKLEELQHLRAERLSTIH